ncbi:universal stress protein [Flavobacterium sandaracinum]|uniref:UspA domain-containing protein n=1 Tax=Flavobacterium sandaracinum TaxID=2541733 RepID=A0A4V2Z1Z3_9FLAO|nr:universal stress protein [Flavobacterium sandaracinum]TDE06918.1 hypothetical protein E0F91_03710 [Flavobacterium sandaracinum]
MKTLLVPTDFSIPADSAINYAMHLAVLWDASLILYHSFIPFESGFYLLSVSQKENLENEKKLMDRLATIQNNILKKKPSLSISIHVDQGPEGIKIIEFCKKKKVDLIIMGTNGASGLKEQLIGSFTAEVMTKATCPVLAIPNKYKFRIPKKITYATNYSKKDKKVLETLLKFNEVFNASINVLHIDWGLTFFTADDDFTKYKKSIQNYFKDFEFSFNHSAGKDITKTILEETLIDNTEMIVMNPLKRKGMWDRLFEKSVTKKMANHIPFPLLTIPTK